MDWRDLAATLVKMGAPVIGTALGGPLGGTIGGIIGSVVASSLGVEATPEAVAQAVTNQSPEAVRSALVQADAQVTNQWDALMGIAKSQAEAVKAEAEAQATITVAGTTAVNETIRVEAQANAASGDGWMGKWRGLHAWELTAECPFVMGTILFAIIRGDHIIINAVVQLSGFLMFWYGARFGVLGVHVWQGSNERQVGMTGIPTQVAKAVKEAVKGKK